VKGTFPKQREIKGEMSAGKREEERKRCKRERKRGR